MRTPPPPPSHKVLEALPPRRLDRLLYRSSNVAGVDLFDFSEVGCRGCAHAPYSRPPVYLGTSEVVALALSARSVADADEEIRIRRLLSEVHLRAAVIDLTDPRSLDLCGLPPSTLAGDDPPLMCRAMAVARRRKDVQGVMARCADEAGASAGLVMLAIESAHYRDPDYVQVLREEIVEFGVGGKPIAPAPS
jgi:hypothetical protein